MQEYKFLLFTKIKGFVIIIGEKAAIEKNAISFVFSLLFTSFLG